MLFKFSTILALAAATHILAALAAEKADDDLIVIQSWPRGNGTLVAYSSAPSAATVRSDPLPPCTEGTTFACNIEVPSITPNVCADLIKAIHDSTDVASPDLDNTLCLDGGEGGYCCVSWSTDLGAFKISDLYRVTFPIYHVCAQTPHLGRAYNYSINGKCVNVCMSNDPSFRCS